MKSRFVISIFTISVISLILIGAVAAMGRLPHYTELRLSPLRVIHTDANSIIDDQIQSCSYLLTKSTLPPLAQRLSGVDFLTTPVVGTTINEHTSSSMVPTESLAQKVSSNDIRCSA